MNEKIITVGFEFSPKRVLLLVDFLQGGEFTVRPGTTGVTGERRNLDDGGIVNDDSDGISLTVRHWSESGECEVPDDRGGNRFVTMELLLPRPRGALLGGRPMVSGQNIELPTKIKRIVAIAHSSLTATN